MNLFGGKKGKIRGQPRKNGEVMGELYGKLDFRSGFPCIPRREGCYQAKGKGNQDGSFFNSYPRTVGRQGKGRRNKGGRGPLSLGVTKRQEAALTGSFKEDNRNLGKIKRCAKEQKENFKVVGPFCLLGLGLAGPHAYLPASMA